MGVLQFHKSADVVRMLDLLNEMPSHSTCLNVRSLRSGPLMDRTDIHVEVPAAEFKELSSKKLGTSSESICTDVTIARSAQIERFDGMPILYNAQMTSKQIREFCPLNDECMNMLKISVNELGLSARAHDKVLRLSRTIADLDGSPDIQAHHLGEAINYRLSAREN